MFSPVFSSHSHWLEFKDYWIQFRYLFLDQVMLYLLFIPVAGVDLIHALVLALRRVGRSCEGIGLMTSNLLNPCHLPSVRNCFGGLVFNTIDMHRFVELGAILEPGRPPKTDKAAILMDAVRMVTQLREESQKLKESTTSLQEKIKELKVRPQFIFNTFLFKIGRLVWGVLILGHFIWLIFLP